MEKQKRVFASLTFPRHEEISIVIAAQQQHVASGGFNQQKFAEHRRYRYPLFMPILFIPRERSIL